MRNPFRKRIYEVCVITGVHGYSCSKFLNTINEKVINAQKQGWELNGEMVVKYNGCSPDTCLQPMKRQIN